MLDLQGLSLLLGANAGIAKEQELLSVTLLEVFRVRWL